MIKCSNSLKFRNFHACHDFLDCKKARNHCTMTSFDFVVGARSLVLYCAKSPRLAWNFKPKARTKFPGRASRLISRVIRFSSLSLVIIVIIFSLSLFSILINGELKFATDRFIPVFFSSQSETFPQSSFTMFPLHFSSLLETSWMFSLQPLNVLFPFFCNCFNVWENRQTYWPAISLKEPLCQSRKRLTSRHLSIFLHTLVLRPRLFECRNRLAFCSTGGHFVVVCLLILRKPWWLWNFLIEYRRSCPSV